MTSSDSDITAGEVSARTQYDGAPARYAAMGQAHLTAIGPACGPGSSEMEMAPSAPAEVYVASQSQVKPRGGGI